MDKTFEYLKQIAKSSKDERVSTIVNILRQNEIDYELQCEKNLTNVKISCKGKSDKTIVLMAHHDIATSTLQGANDNTASVAVLLSIAEHLKTHICRQNVIIGLVDHEEHLGALFAKNVSTQDKIRIATNVGSFLFLRELDKSNISCVINLEMSGIGDKIFIAKSSGNIACSPSLNAILHTIAESAGVKCQDLAISNSDYLSAYIHKLSATVIGCLPSSPMIDHYGILIPRDWATMHTPQDTIDKIDRSSLAITECFVKNILDNADLFLEIKR